MAFPDEGSPAQSHQYTKHKIVELEEQDNSAKQGGRTMACSATSRNSVAILDSLIKLL
jgi:hypothetical protein